MHNYYFTQGFRYRYFCFFTLMIALVIGLFLYFWRTIPCLEAYAVGLGLFSWYRVIDRMEREHIAISENGIEYYSPWSILETNWGSIEKISYGWHNQIWLEGLLVDTSSIQIKKHSLGDRSLQVFYSQKMIIPLSCFSNNWRESELGQQIKQYAPKLFS